MEKEKIESIINSCLDDLINVNNFILHQGFVCPAAKKNMNSAYQITFSILERLGSIVRADYPHSPVIQGLESAQII
jgi:hypothetical protein